MGRWHGPAYKGAAKHLAADKRREADERAARVKPFDVDVERATARVIVAEYEAQRRREHLTEEQHAVRRGIRQAAAT